MQVDVSYNKLSSVAKAIRLKNSEADLYLLSKIPDKIRSLKPSSSKAPGTYDLDGNIVRTWEQLLSEGVVTVNNGELTTKNITDPETYKIYGSFTPGSPYYNSLERTIIIDDGVVSIGRFAFLDSDFMDIVLPKKIKKIDTQAFWGWNRRESNTPYVFNIPNTIEVLSDSSLAKMLSVTKFNIPSTITPDQGLGPRVFSYCNNLKEFAFPNGWTRTGEGTLGGSGIHKVSFPESLTKIDNGCFSNCENLTDIEFTESITEIGDQGFGECIGLEQIVLPNNIKILGSRAFSSCAGLKHVYIPIGLESIGFMAFYGCTGLTEITIPNSVTSIDYDVFGECTNLRTIHYSGSATGAPWGAPNATVVP